MKVVAINGSPRPQGNTQHAIEFAAKPLREAGIDVQVLDVGAQAIRGCIACNYCRKEGRGCVFADEPFMQYAQAMYDADGVILASPTYYAGIAGTMKCFLDRAFYQSTGRMRHKIGGVIAIDRRAGAMLTYDQLAHYLTISEMILVPSQYWTMARAQTPGQVLEDEEGVRIMTKMGENMAHLLEKLR